MIWFVVCCIVLLTLRYTLLILQYYTVINLFVISIIQSTICNIQQHSISIRWRLILRYQMRVDRERMTTIYKMILACSNMEIAIREFLSSFCPSNMCSCSDRYIPVSTNAAKGTEPSPSEEKLQQQIRLHSWSPHALKRNCHWYPFCGKAVESGGTSQEKCSSYGTGGTTLILN